MKEFLIDVTTFLLFRKRMVSAWKNERRASFRRKLFFIAAVFAGLTAAVISGALFIRKLHIHRRELKRAVQVRSEEI